MHLTFDQEANALYIKLSEAPVASTVTESSNVLVDLTATGELVGIEVLDPAKASEVPGLLSKYGLQAGRLDYGELGRVLSGASSQ